jgi:hypothetical protein
VHRRQFSLLEPLPHVAAALSLNTAPREFEGTSNSPWLAHTTFNRSNPFSASKPQTYHIVTGRFSSPVQLTFIPLLPPLSRRRIRTRQQPPLILPKNRRDSRPRIPEIDPQLAIFNLFRKSLMLPLPLKLIMPIRLLVPCND